MKSNIASIPIGAESKPSTLVEIRRETTWKAKNSREKMMISSLNVFCLMLYHSKNVKLEYSKKV